jgi:hypothetical protein
MDDKVNSVIDRIYNAMPLIMLIALFIVGFMLGYAVNSQSRIDDAYNRAVLECNDLFKNITAGGQYGTYRDDYITNYFNESKNKRLRDYTVGVR